MREIITLQFGNKANWVGSNYWNLQVFLISSSSQPNPGRVPVGLPPKPGKCQLLDGIRLLWNRRQLFLSSNYSLWRKRYICFHRFMITILGNYGSLNCQTGHFKVSTSNSEPDVISNPSVNWYTLKRSSCLDSLGVETRIRSFDLRMYSVFPLVTISFSRLVSSSFASFLVLDVYSTLQSSFFV